MTGFFDGLVAVVAVAILNFAVVFQLSSGVRSHESRFLARVYGLTLLLRCGLAILLNLYAANSAFSLAFWGDSESYDIGGSQLARRWAGEPVMSAYTLASVSGYGWVYFVGTIYYLVGRNQLLVQLLNATLGSLTVLVIYAIAARLFGRAPARWAALFMAFFPQMVFWSAAMYKDPAILLCIALCMYAVLALRDRFSLSMIVLFVASVLFLMTLRFYIAYFVVFAAIASFLFAQRRGGAVRNIFTYGVLAALLFGAVSVAIKRETLEQQASYVNLERLQITRQDQAMWGSSGFGQEQNVSTAGGALVALPVGLVYLLFAPFPWAISGLRQALALPETLVWYALMPAFVRGLTYGVKHRWREVLPILVFATTLTGAYAIMQGNVGTAYRQRTQISMFFFVFMGVGLVQRRQRKMADALPEPIEDRSSNLNSGRAFLG
jgi:4-amino-4-deoxy-L-arabinose transferase-like glycosyltransferase